MVKHLPPGAGDQDPGSGRSQEEMMASHSSVLAWRIPLTEEPGGAVVHGVTKSQT